MLTDRLKTSTRQAHQDLEKLIIQKIKALRSEQEYANFLKAFYGYIAALEIEIERVITADLVADFHERRKAASLLEDIKTFNPFASEPVLCKDIPEIRTFGQALGALYVLEGSTLGGRFILKMIADRLNLQTPHGLTFFRGYGEKTELMWETFKESLNNRGSEPHIAADIIESANQTFIKFEKWINSLQW